MIRPKQINNQPGAVMITEYRNLRDAAEKGGFFDRLAAIYVEMDRAYDAVADQYGFSCTGCVDNCCMTRFHHHTAIEYTYLVRGFMDLPRDRRSECMERASAYNREMKRVLAENGSFSRMCPLNENGFCLLYSRRPMICRLHGIPHEIAPPGRAKTYGAGCGAFEAQCGKGVYHPFDRTPFYTAMADLERRFKDAAGISEKVKMTVAEMLSSVAEHAP